MSERESACARERDRASKRARTKASERERTRRTRIRDREQERKSTREKKSTRERARAHEKERKKEYATERKHYVTRAEIRWWHVQNSAVAAGTALSCGITFCWSAARLKLVYTRLAKYPNSEHNISREAEKCSDSEHNFSTS